MEIREIFGVILPNGLHGAKERQTDQSISNIFLHRINCLFGVHLFGPEKALPLAQVPAMADSLEPQYVG